MSLISQIAMVVLIIMIAAILTYTNKGLEKAEQEGERFVDEWVLKQQKQEAKKSQSDVTGSMESQNDNGEAVDLPLKKHDDEEAVDLPLKKHDNVILLRTTDKKLLTLTVIDEEKNVWKKTEVDHYPFYIGRSSENDLVLDDLYVARKHCEILEENGAIVLRDRGSSNRFYAQGRQLSELILSDKIRFYIGNYEFIVTEHKRKSNPTILASRMEKISV